MDIRFVSSLTPEDEARLAPALIQALSAVLDLFPIAYTLRVDTSGGQAFHHAHEGPLDPDAIDETLVFSPARSRVSDSLAS